MAKKRSIKMQPVEAKDEATATETPPAMEEVNVIGLATAIVEVPLGEVGEKEYLSNHVEARLTTNEQRVNWKRLCRGLQQQGATTKDGRAVQRPGQVVRWILERISESD